MRFRDRLSRLHSHRSRLRVAAAASVLALTGSVMTAADASAASLPGGRANYVVSVISGRTGAVAVRLATYQFSTNGRVVEQYWSWRQNSISGKGNSRWTKPASGYRTSGCRRNCPIRTPVGFQSGRRGTRATGRWRVSGSVLTVRWGRSVERWRLDTSVRGVVGATLVTRDPQAHGWALGSRASLRTAVPIKTLYRAQRFYGPLARNSYGTPTTTAAIGFAYQDYRLCPNGTCMQGRYVTSSNKRRWFSSYWAANPSRDGRKVFWNFQTGTVQQAEQPGSVCISRSGGGHTDALLQALDDSGHIIGLVGVEASLNQRKRGQALVSAFAMVLPTHQSLVF
jgi:hypothetical protein